jgi:hypothetical protein
LDAGAAIGAAHFCSITAGQAGAAAAKLTGFPLDGGAPEEDGEATDAAAIGAAGVAEGAPGPTSGPQPAKAATTAATRPAPGSLQSRERRRDGVAPIVAKGCW